MLFNIFLVDDVNCKQKKQVRCGKYY